MGQATEADSGKKSVTLLPHQIVLRPLVTEKGMHRATRNNQYAFEVNPLADKRHVSEAVETLFDVKVLKVRTQNRKGKPRRYRFKWGRTKNWKKAIVTLDAEHRIDFFQATVVALAKRARGGGGGGGEQAVTRIVWRPARRGVWLRVFPLRSAGPYEVPRN